MAALDEHCRAFSSLIREAARDGLSGDAWQAVDGRLARMLLCDQFSRNAFRGTPEVITAQRLPRVQAAGRGGKEGGEG